MKIYSIGHSTRTFEDFAGTLKKYGIDMVVDIRRFPGSNKFPQFNLENLEKELPRHGIYYVHFADLGGFRKEGYVAFSQTPEFKEKVKKFLGVIKGKHAAMMCAEILWFRCHRRHVAEELIKLGHSVTHIYNKERVQEHKLREAEIEEKMALSLSCDDREREFLETL